jgi:pimeloyl-ACP methyl ester carboxylesterase
MAQDADPMSLRHGFIATNGIRMYLAEQGSGPLVLLCHGFPESWYSWRHQLPALAAAGFHAVAPDQRGYGQTDRPEAIDRYTILHLVGDMVGLLDALGAETAVIVGHDWGSPVAWNAALMRPDRFRAVISLSVPYSPRPAVRSARARPLDADTQFYTLYFQAPGVAEAELERDVRASIRRVLYTLSGDAPADGRWRPILPRDGGFLTHSVDPTSLPDWLTESDLDFYSAEFARTGFRGGLNWYRNIDRNWELTAPFAGAPITVPALFVAGERDLVISFPGMADVVARQAALLPKLHKAVLLPGCGHWTQQERPDAVNAEILEFLRGL